MSQEERNWYQNEVDEEIKGVDSRDKVKHNGQHPHRMRSVIFREDDDVGQA